MKMCKIMCKMVLVLCCCLTITTGAGAAVITGDPGGNFNVEGPADDFVNWASTNHSVSVLPGQTPAHIFHWKILLFVTDGQFFMSDIFF